MKHVVETRRGLCITTQNGSRIRARRCVIAAGFESKLLLRGDAGQLKSTYAIISEPQKPERSWYEKCLIWESGLPYLYLRTTEEGRIIVGGEDETFVSAKQRDECLSTKTRTLVRKFRLLFPDSPFEIAYSWAGTFAQTKDGLAYIGTHPRFPHLYFALGYGGNGITFSLIAAELLRDAFLGLKNPDAKIFRFGR